MLLHFNNYVLYKILLDVELITRISKHGRTKNIIRNLKIIIIDIINLFAYKHKHIKAFR